jgi:hypothetical protein
MSTLTVTSGATHTWVIREWSKKRDGGVLRSEIFSVGGHNW